MAATGDGYMPEKQYRALQQLARDDPLAHPLTAAIRLHDYPYPPATHLREIYGAAFRAISPKHPHAPKNLLRLYPREHAKSEAVSHVLPSWAALRDPNIRILIMSESMKQASNKLEECRRTIERWGPTFGRTIRNNSRRELTLERDKTFDVGTITAAGFETSVTGGHYDIIVFDDVVSYQNQRTETRRETVEKEFQNFLNLGSEGKTLYFVIGTRKHPEDLYGRLLDSVAWDTECKKAISDFSVVENGEYGVITNTGQEYDSVGDVPGGETVTGVQPHREVETLWPARWPLHKLIYDYLTASTEGEGSRVWIRENQNDAHALTGQILDEEMLSWTSSLPKPREAYKWYGGVDVAIVDDSEKAATGDTDYWAVAILAHDPIDKESFLVDIRRRRGMSMREGLAWVERALGRFSMTRTLVEKNQAQRWLVQEAKDQGLRVEGSNSTGDKAERILAMSSRFEAEKVRICDGLIAGDDSRWQAFVSEWCMFAPEDDDSHDDMLDAVEIAMRNIARENVTKSKYTMSDLPL